MSTSDPTDARVKRGEYAAALCGCAERLKPRSRSIWLLRVLFELPSKQIATHPEVTLNPGHVDVILQRCRQIIRDCMQKLGYEPRDMPPGTFAELWKAFRLESSLETHGGSW